ncbi:hypothetical protein D3C85_1627540 [compost metagenome]
MLGAIGLQGGSDQEVDVAGQVVKQDLAVLRVNVGAHDYLFCYVITRNDDATDENQYQPFFLPRWPGRMERAQKREAGGNADEVMTWESDGLLSDERGTRC